MFDAEVEVAPVRAREAWWVAALTVLALGLRAWQLQHAGLSQFDEGVYAFSGLGLSDPTQPHRLFPDQEKFSPPVYFSLVALSFLVFGAADRSAILVNVLLGTATVPAVWWIARRWVGAPAALAAALMLATRGGHILLSRSALTDVTFALVFLIALGVVAVALDRADRTSGVLAGLAVGLAWNTKYHGWFALVIAVLAIGAKWRIERQSLDSLKPVIRTWIVMSVVAAACYLPWTVFVNSQPGGSAGWASYFATMLRIDWFGGLASYSRQFWLLEGPWSRSSIALAIVIAGLWRARAAQGGVSPRLLVLGLVGALLGSEGTAVVLAVLAVVRRLRSRTPIAYGVWCMIALVALWVVMAPLYQPYFRLMVPFSIATFILAGDELAYRLRGPAEPRPLLAMGVLGAAVSIAILIPRHTQWWRDNRSLAMVAAGVDRSIPAGAPIAVIGEPPLAFYLHLLGHAAFDRVTLKELDGGTVPVYVIAGRYAQAARSLRDGLRERASVLDTLGRFPMVPSDLRLLDDYGPFRAPAYRAHPDSSYDLVLFRYDPARRVVDRR